MTSQLTSNKLIALLLLLVLLGGSVAAFPHSMLGSAGKDPSPTLTVAGQARQCSEYPDESGTFIGAKTITSAKYPALVNIYLVQPDGGWKYYAEFTAPVSINQGSRLVAYEIYYCPTPTATCSNGQVRAVTETTYQTCSGGQWGTAQKCAIGTYFSPRDGKCISTTCREQWTCGQWGQCTADGVQYRSCTDTKACGTSKDMPRDTQSCTPVYSKGVTPGPNGGSYQSPFGLQLVGQPSLDKYEGAKAGEPRTVTQEFEVTVPGEYWVEAGIEQMRGFDITGSVEKNTCNPDQPWYANQKIAFPTVGKTKVQFKVTPQADGQYALHTAIVTGCGGKVIDQSNAVDNLYVGSGEGGQQNAGGWLRGHLGLVIVMMAIVLLAIAGMIWAAKRK